MPSISTVVVTAGSAVSGWIGTTGERLNAIVHGDVQSPLMASSSAWRSVPFPLSSAEVTVIELGGSMTSTVALPLLFARFGSLDVLVTDALFVSAGLDVAGAVTLMVIGLAVPAASVSIEQVMVGGVAALSEHAQPVPVAETSVTPLGSVSVTVTSVALLGPELLTPIV
jgi:hypothetical protein